MLSYIISLEIGTSAVRAAAVTYDNDATSTAPLTLVALAEQPLHGGVRYGRIQNIHDVTDAVEMALDALTSNPAVTPRRITGVYVGVGGRSLASITAEAHLALPDEDDITREIVERLENDAAAAVPDGREVMDVIPVQYTIDGVRARRPIGSVGNNIDGRYTIVTCDPVNIRNIERVVARQLHLDICGYIVRPLAVAAATLNADNTNPGCMLADIGAETITVSIFKKGVPVYVATIPMGSQNITRDLAAGLGIVEEKAEEIKIRLGNAMPEGMATGNEQIEIDSIVQARANEIAANIAAHVEYAGMTPDDIPDGIVLTGRGARLRGLAQLLAMQTRMPVRMAQLPASLRIEDNTINAADYLDVIGVAMIARTFADDPDAIPCVTSAVAIPSVDELRAQAEAEDRARTQTQAETLAAAQVASGATAPDNDTDNDTGNDTGNGYDYGLGRRQAVSFDDDDNNRRPSGYMDSDTDTDDVLNDYDAPRKQPKKQAPLMKKLSNAFSNFARFATKDGTEGNDLTQ